MYNLNIDSKKLELLKRSNNLLERTRKKYKKYESERKLLLELTTNMPEDYAKWEKILDSIETLVKSEEWKGEHSSPLQHLQLISNL